MSKRWKGPVPGKVNKAYEGRPEAHEKYKDKQRQYYSESAETQRQKANERVAQRRLRNQKWMVKYMLNKSCKSCGVSDPRVLTFNHLDRGTKFANVADLVSRGSKIEHLESEVNKCEILCHNCHMLITLEQLGGSYHDKLKGEV